MRRRLIFKTGMGPSEGVTEILTFRGMTAVDILIIETGNLITNVISTGAGKNELYLTLTYDGEFLEIQDGTKEARKKERMLIEQAAAVVPHTIEQIRSLVREGKL